MNLQELHEKILYPVVRVRSVETGGSGTVIYSEPDPDNEGEYLSFVMTCTHVVEDAITTKKEWDSVLGKDIKKEFKEQVGVEVFDYVYLSKVNSSNSYRADIVAYDKRHDIAILKLISPKKVDYVAELVPPKEIRDVKCFMPTWTSGCSLLHDPFANPGNVTSLTEIIDQKNYWMGNGNSIFGNSGGAVFLADTGQQIGITARVKSINFGFNVDILTWMGFMVPPERMYEFFKEQELKFLYDPKDTYKKAMARRKKKAEKVKMLSLEKEKEGEEGEDKSETKEEEDEFDLPF